MTALRSAALGFLVLVVLTALSAGVLPIHHYAEQSREFFSVPPSAQYPLGADELGRDRLSRLLFGARLSLLLAPAAAALSTLIAAVAGTLAAHRGGLVDKLFGAFIDAFVSLPWFFVLIACRAVLPLNTGPETSAAVTFLLLGCLGWPLPARMIRAGAKSVFASDHLLQAQAAGIPFGRIFRRHILPNLKPLVTAQFWIAVPVFIISEANLSLLGLGVAEPLPSWGGLLRELENFTLLAQSPWIVVPALLLALVVGALQFLTASREVRP